jgi:hypothetical protein
MDRMHYQLEIAGKAATLYVAGSLDHDSAQALVLACGALPTHVRTLRLDLRALGAMTAEATGAVRLLLRRWCESRHGTFRLSASYLVATCSEVGPRQAMMRSGWGGLAVGGALMAT